MSLTSNMFPVSILCSSFNQAYMTQHISVFDTQYLNKQHYMNEIKTCCSTAHCAGHNWSNTPWSADRVCGTNLPQALITASLQHRDRVLEVSQPHTHA